MVPREADTNPREKVHLSGKHQHLCWTLELLSSSRTVALLKTNAGR